MSGKFVGCLYQTTFYKSHIEMCELLLLSDRTQTYNKTSRLSAHSDTNDPWNCSTIILKLPISLAGHCFLQLR